jgi:tRNA threonylcarbamoyl adenosine modification protein YeaZ
LVNPGPGSFTGIRVGLNLARTLAFALDRPLASLDALTILAHKYLKPGERGVIALKAVRNHLYVGGFARHADRLEVTDPPRSLERVDPRLSGTEVRIEGETPDFDPHPRASDLLRASLDLPALTPFSDWDRAKPLYIRGSEAEEKLRK